MRLARKLFLVVAAAIAMIAFAAPTANAVRVLSEPGGVPCPEVDVTNNNLHTVTGGCLVTVATEPGTTVDFNAHFNGVGEVVLTRCDNTFSARIHEAGDGLLFNQVLSGVNCNALVECREGATTDIPWPATLMEFPLAAPQAREALQFTFCTTLTPNPTSVCTINIPVVTDATHTYEFRTLAPGPNTPVGGGAPLQSRCSQNAATSLTAHWAIGGTPIEIQH